MTRIVVALLAWCSVAFPGSALAAKSSLRFDGLYVCHRSSSAGPVTFYLRFYPDGVVISTLSTGTPKDLATWFNRQKQPNFHYELHGSTIRFTEQSSGMIFVYRGTVARDSLPVQVDGYDAKTKKYMGTVVDRAYTFVPAAMKP